MLDTLDIMMEGTYGMHNHAYLLLAFEDFFAKEASRESSFHLENFINDFCERRVRQEDRESRD